MLKQWQGSGVYLVAPPELGSADAPQAVLHCIREMTQSPLDLETRAGR